jgi:hypothetical protein
MTASAASSACVKRLARAGGIAPDAACRRRRSREVWRSGERGEALRRPRTAFAGIGDSIRYFFPPLSRPS